MPGNPGQIPKYVISYVIKYNVFWTVNFLSDEVTRCCKQLCSTYLNFPYFIGLILPVSNTGPWGSVQKKLQNRQEIWWSVKPQLLWESPFEDSLLLHLVIIKNLWIAYQCLYTEKRQLHSRMFDMCFESATKTRCRMQAWVTDDEIVSPVLFSLCVNDIPTLSLHVELVYHDDRTAKSFMGCNRTTPVSGLKKPSNQFSYFYHPLTSSPSPQKDTFALYDIVITGRPLPGGGGVECLCK